ncbi:hypothetical protein MBCUT_01760 [Methanobrevibacter cuticularis]|uniref:Uncharacterized protein n=1 Tax=Methanobrevibacter cuticularis TaxID=47311 RepID=A0A166FDC6_9EURY|nr:hypothetical protein [Methanobrevibacter cuticularis]KZX17561.1 hypothetical protein MBCUT_01760 [Methanobrevibacter cuticularis]
MKFNRLLLIIGIVVLVSVFVMSTSFAASKKSESIYSDKISRYISEDSYKTKISEIKKTDIINVKKGGSTKGNFKISVKDSFKNKYKIKSVTVVYKHRYTDSDIMDEVERKVYKTYKSKNKKILTIRDLSSLEGIDYEFVNIVINYKTNKKLKQETTYLKKAYRYKSTTVYIGKTAVVKDITVGNLKNFVHIIKVKATNSKYKIKTFKVIFYSYIDIIGTIYGHGKNSLVVKGPMHYDPRSEGDFEITYY